MFDRVSEPPNWHRRPTSICGGGLWAKRGVLGFVASLMPMASAFGQEPAPAPPARGLDAWGLLEAGGTIGWIIMAISVWMVALFIQHLLSLRASSPRAGGAGAGS